MVLISAFVKPKYVKIQQTSNFFNSSVTLYSINLCPDDRMSALSSIVGYHKEYVFDEETGEKKEVVLAKDMNICLFDLNGDEEEFRYEGLLYVVYLIDSCVAK